MPPLTDKGALAIWFLDGLPPKNVLRVKLDWLITGAWKTLLSPTSAASPAVLRPKAGAYSWRIAKANQPILVCIHDALSVGDSADATYVGATTCSTHR